MPEEPVEEPTATPTPTRAPAAGAIECEPGISQPSPDGTYCAPIRRGLQGKAALGRGRHYERDRERAEEDFLETRRRFPR